MKFTSSIIPGRGVGRQLGFPTLNFEIPENFTIEEGVYAARVKSPLFRKEGSGEILQSVLFYGHRQTFDNQKALEVHILDRRLNQIPTEAEFEVLDKIREIEKFENAEELKKQIAKDCETARKILGLK